MNARQEATEAIQELHKEIIEDLIQLEDEIDALTKRQGQMRSVVENLEALYEGLPQYSEGSNGDNSPRGQKAVEQVLADNAEQWMSIKDITSQMKLRRWIDRDARDPEAAVRAALRRLIDSDGPSIDERREGRSVLYRMREPDSDSLPGL